VDNHGSSLFWVVPDNPLAEAEQCSGELWHPMVWPHHEVELTHLPDWHLYFALASKLQMEGGRKGGREEGREQGRE